MIRTERTGELSWLVVGQARYPAELVSEDVPLPSGYVHRVRRASVYFESGWRVSVVWGSATYSDNRSDLSTGVFTEEPCHVEVAVPWDGRWEPLSLVTAEELNKLLEQMATWPSDRPPPMWAQQGYLDRHPG